MTFANFNFFGKIPRENEEFALSANGLDIVIRTIFIRLGGIS